MDRTRFGDLPRSVANSRRSLVSGLLALATGFLTMPGVAARKQRRKKEAAKARCEGGARCRPQSRAATCAGRCGTWRNNCDEPVTCGTCASGQQCLSNGSCAVARERNADCGACGGSNPGIEGERHCIAGPLQPYVLCANTADCPPGSHCQDIGFGGVCIELCD